MQFHGPNTLLFVRLAQTGAALIVLPNGNVSGLTAEAGSLVLSSGFVFLSGAAVEAFGASPAANSVLASGTTGYLLPGTVAAGLSAGSGAAIVVAGGTVSGSVISGGGMQMITGLGSFASGTLVLTGAIELVDGGATNATVLSGGTQNVVGNNHFSGSAMNTIIGADSLQHVTDGGARLEQSSAAVALSGSTDLTMQISPQTPRSYKAAACYASVGSAPLEWSTRPG